MQRGQMLSSSTLGLKMGLDLPDLGRRWTRHGVPTPEPECSKYAPPVFKTLMCLKGGLHGSVPGFGTKKKKKKKVDSIASQTAAEGESLTCLGPSRPSVNRCRVDERRGCVLWMASNM